jgi:hypothetical protein
MILAGVIRFEITRFLEVPSGHHRIGPEKRDYRQLGIGLSHMTISGLHRTWRQDRFIQPLILKAGILARPGRRFQVASHNRRQKLSILVQGCP